MIEGVEAAYGNGNLAVTLMAPSGARVRKALDDYLLSLIA